MIKTHLGAMIGGAFWTPGCTVIGGNTSTFGQQILKLFANNEQGFAYVPNDLTTLYQDAAGTIPVTAAGQPVGLMLDKSKGLAFGGEIASNGNFEGGLIGSKLDGLGSSSTWELNTVSPISGTQDGKLTITTSVSGRPFIDFGGVDKKVGELYETSFDYKVTSGSIVILGLLNGAAIALINRTLNGVGKFTSRVVRLGIDSRDIVYFGNSVGTIQIDNVSVKRILGNHAYQNTSAARPILQDVPRRIDFDAVDDNLITNLPAQLTGCTVIRSVPNVGTQILTNQTIPTTYNDNIDNCGLIVINRSLTPSETTQITKLFNKAAGV